MTRTLAVLLLVVATAPAAAESRKLMVLPADGRADGKLKAKVDAAVAKLAKSSGETVTIGEVSYNDMAAAVGCKPDEASCRDEVIATLAVDEIVITSVSPKPGGFDVTVRRASKGNAGREASALVTSDKPDALDPIAPLFGGRAAATPATASKPAVTAPPPTTKPAVTAPPSKPAVTAPPPSRPGPPPATSTTSQGKVFGPPPAPASEPALPPAREQTPPPQVPPPKRVAESRMPDPVPANTEQRDVRFLDSRRVQLAGMVTGGLMLVTGFVLWGKASDYQDQVDHFPRPIRSREQLAELQYLEDQGDAYATWRTVFVVGGLAVGGVSTYLFIRGRGRSATHASITPTLLDHGGGLTFTFSGVSGPRPDGLGPLRSYGGSP